MFKMREISLKVPCYAPSHEITLYSYITKKKHGPKLLHSHQHHLDASGIMFSATAKTKALKTHCTLPAQPQTAD